MSRRNTDFQTIHSEGGLLPPDLLRRILDPRGKIPGAQPEDYGLPKGERINEVITQSWNRLRRHWVEFRDAAQNLPPREPATGLTNDKWSLPLLRELGFGMLPTSPGPEIDGRTYAINRFFGAAAIHLVGCGLSLDRRAAGVRGAAAANPHGLVQEFLNRSQGHLWAIVSNGLRFRVLRDNQALSRQSYLEFDLESMFTGEVFSDFVLLWLTAHATRFVAPEDGKLENCLLEQWTKLANEQGTRALESLRSGVEKALQVLGQGFVGHPRNTALREALRSGELTLSDFHSQLLRVVYRLIFLFVAEDRTLDGIPLIHTRLPEEELSSSSPNSLTPYSLYSLYYSTARLRELAARIRGSRHGDLWQQFNLLVGALSGEEQFVMVCENLALPPLGSFLWSPESTPALNATSLTDRTGTELTNADFLEALRHLAFTRQDKILRPVDYKNLGSDEFGGIYASFLALTPQLSGDGARFNFAEFAGNERKTSGSYYTPDCLVQCLLDSALDPVVEDRLDQAREWARELANSEIGIRERKQKEDKDDSELISGLDSVAESNGPGGTMLSSDEELPEGRVVRHDITNPKGGIFNPGKHSRRMGQGGDSGIHTVPADSTGKPQRSGDASDSIKTGGTGQARPGRAASESMHGSRQDAERPHWFLEAQKEWLKLQSHSSSYHSPSSPSSFPSSPTSLPPYSLSPYSFLAEKAILTLKVCDTSVGSGHFLLGAAHRLARHLARVRALAMGESEPSPLLYQQALRDVIGHCLYGVDINPMAVELCKVTLWLEALEPGKPLSFLDHHIQCGNSLIGATPELIEQGIPDDAFTPITGDDKAYCTKYKKKNKEEREVMLKQRTVTADMFEDYPWEHLGNLPTAIAKLDALKDDTIEEIQEKQKQYAEMVRSSDYVHARFLADAWCAAFVWIKRASSEQRVASSEENKSSTMPPPGHSPLTTHHSPSFPYPITTAVLQQIERNPQSVYDFTPWLRDEVKRLAQQYQFFHWHLAFPEVFHITRNSEIVNSEIANSEIANREKKSDSSSPDHSPFAIHHSPSSGFNILLGNPPWERVKLQEKEWFAERSPDIANAPNSAARKRMINDLIKNDPALYRLF